MFPGVTDKGLHTIETDMLWPQGKNKFYYFGLAFWRERPKIQMRKQQKIRKKEPVSLSCSYQLYTGSSDWSRITFRVKSKHVTKLDYTLRIQLKDEKPEQYDNTIAYDLSAFGESCEPEYSLYNFFVKKEVTQQMEKIQFDVILTTNKKSKKNFEETILLNLKTSEKKNTVYVLVQSLQEKIPIETAILEDADVKFRNATQLCDREVEFVNKRKADILEHMRNNLKLKNLGNCQSVPNIAVIGSGGGMRAVVGMCGAMTALKDNHILDSTMYTAGLSGSAWYLLALFSNDKQHNPKELNAIIRQKLKTFSRLQFIELFYAWKLTEKILRATHILQVTVSFTDSFGFMIGKVLNEKEKDYLSAQTKKLEDGSIPLPLISALHVRDARSIREYHEWIELSPYEVYIPKYGAAIDMKRFGDKMHGGFGIEGMQETTIAFLLGMCGGAYAKVRNFKPSEDKWYMFWRGFNYRISSLLSTVDKLFIGKVPNVLRGLTIKELLNDVPVDVKDLVDFKANDMMLVDAGLAFNSPYPTVLHPARKVDVILSFDFSNRYRDKKWPFQELESAAKWAKQRKIPFPNIGPQLLAIREEWNEGKYEEVYVFPGHNSPTIVHFVMINKSFRKTDGTKSDFNILPRFRTVKFHYTNRQFDKLYKLVQHNVIENGNTIKDCIQKVIDQKTEESQKTE